MMSWWRYNMLCRAVPLKLEGVNWLAAELTAVRYCLYRMFNNQLMAWIAVAVQIAGRERT